MTGVFECDLGADEILSGVEVRRASGSARWGYYKHCRKTGEFAHAIGAFFFDPEASVCRAVVGARGRKPIVFADATSMLGGKRKAPSIEVAEHTMRAHGMTDAIEQQVHWFACGGPLIRRDANDRGLAYHQ